jgi:hypothetical protein
LAIKVAQGAGHGLALWALAEPFLDEIQQPVGRQIGTDAVYRGKRDALLLGVLFELIAHHGFADAARAVDVEHPIAGLSADQAVKQFYFGITADDERFGLRHSLFSFGVNSMAWVRLNKIRQDSLCSYPAGATLFISQFFFQHVK